MTTETPQASSSLVGLYATSAVDWIEQHVVTEAMVDYAISRAHQGKERLHRTKKMFWIEDPARRAKARRNIAIGIRAGSYALPILLRKGSQG